MTMKNIFIILILFVFNSIQILAENQQPQVTNVKFSQRPDASLIVDVYYEVNDPEGSTMTITMQASNNNGVNWDFSCDNVTGDIGAGITNGAKHIEWDFAAEHPETFGDQFKIKIIADDGGDIFGVPCPGTPTVIYAGKTYNTVQIGEQCWLKENLDVGTMINSTTSADSMRNNGILEKYCYDNNPASCVTYGGLYQWNEAMQYTTNEGAQGICPADWHIPTLAEFEALKAAVNNDGNSLKAVGQGTGDGAGTNTSGFSALLAGARYSHDGNFFSLGYYAIFYSSSEYDATIAFYMVLWHYLDITIGLSSDYKDFGFSVRCVKD